MSLHFAQTHITVAITTHQPPNHHNSSQTTNYHPRTTKHHPHSHHPTTLTTKPHSHPNNSTLSNPNSNHKYALPDPPTDHQTPTHTQTKTHSTPTPLTPTLHPHPHPSLLSHLSRPPSLHIRAPLPTQRRTHTPRPHARLYPCAARRPAATASPARQYFILAFGASGREKAGGEAYFYLCFDDHRRTSRKEKRERRGESRNDGVAAHGVGYAAEECVCAGSDEA